MDDWIEKTWQMHKMECYSALKKKRILPSVTTWMNLEDIMLSERSQATEGQTQRDSYTFFSFTP